MFALTAANKHVDEKSFIDDHMVGSLKGQLLAGTLTLPNFTLESVGLETEEEVPCRS